MSLTLSAKSVCIPLFLVFVLTALAHANDAVVTPGASQVTIATVDGKATLSVNDKPFVVNGAGMGFTDEQGINTLAEAGGNAFRTWGTSELDAQLNAAAKNNLMVLVGLELATQLHGFDYQDTDSVKRQHDKLLSVVQQYKHHPSVLGWILGNEPNLMVNAQGQVIPADSAVYSAIGTLANSIKSLDPNHPVTVAFAFTATLAEDIQAALTAAPSLDFLSLQAYGALPVIPKLIDDLELSVPFMITEYGPLGHWEMPATTWGREIEEPSGYKARGMRDRMQGSVVDEPTGLLLGSFAFLWGQKQERTPTWYGLFLASGERTASVDELTQTWTGRWPDNRAPSAWSITLQDQTADKSVQVKRGERMSATAVIDDPENDVLSVRWQLLEEVDVRSHGGHFEQQPESIALHDAQTNQEGDQFTITFTAPLIDNEYRLFVYATDNNGGGATANIPFKIEGINR